MNYAQEPVLHVRKVQFPSRVYLIQMVASVISLDSTVEVAWNLQKSSSRKEHVLYFHMGIFHSVGVSKNS